MGTGTKRITARVNIDVRELLERAAALSGISSINAFVLNAAIEKAHQIVQKEQTLTLSKQDAMLLVEALDSEESHPRLQKAFKRYTKSVDENRSS